MRTLQEKSRAIFQRQEKKRAAARRRTKKHWARLERKRQRIAKRKAAGEAIKRLATERAQRKAQRLAADAAKREAARIKKLPRYQQIILEFKQAHIIEGYMHGYNDGKTNQPNRYSPAPPQRNSTMP